MCFKPSMKNVFHVIRRNYVFRKSYHCLSALKSFNTENNCSTVLTTDLYSNLQRIFQYFSIIICSIGVRK